MIGAGPAGSITALGLAQRGWQVTLCEATAFDTDRYGETLPPQITPLLRHLGLWDAFQALKPVQSPGILSAWGDGLPFEQDFLFNVHGPGWHVDRNRFDAMLCAAAEQAGVAILLNHKASSYDGAQWIIDATGRNGLRLGGSYDRRFDDVLLATVLHVVFNGPSPPDLRTYIESSPSGWWYTAPLPQGQLIAMFFTDPATYRCLTFSVARMLSDAPLTAERLSGSTIVKSRVVYSPSSCRKNMAGDGWLAVGDSASSYDPLSGAGIVKAIKQGISAAAALDSGDLDTYAAGIRADFNAYLDQRRGFYTKATLHQTQPFWQARQSRSVGELL